MWPWKDKTNYYEIGRFEAREMFDQGVLSMLPERFHFDIADDFASIYALRRWPLLHKFVKSRWRERYIEGFVSCWREIIAEEKKHWKPAKIQIPALGLTHIIPDISTSIKTPKKRARMIVKSWFEQGYVDVAGSFIAIDQAGEIRITDA